MAQMLQRGTASLDHHECYVTPRHSLARRVWAPGAFLNFILATVVCARLDLAIRCSYPSPLCAVWGQLYQRSCLIRSWLTSEYISFCSGRTPGKHLRFSNSDTMGSPLKSFPTSGPWSTCATDRLRFRRELRHTMTDKVTLMSPEDFLKEFVPEAKERMPAGLATLLSAIPKYTDETKTYGPLVSSIALVSLQRLRM